MRWSRSPSAHTQSRKPFDSNDTTSTTTTKAEEAIECNHISFTHSLSHPLHLNNMGNSVTPAQAATEPSKEELSNYAQGPYWSEKPDAEAIIRYSQKGPAS